MESNHDELILWVTPVGRVTKTAWLINEPINGKTTLDGYFGTYPKYNEDLYSKITVESVSTIASTVTIDPGNVMEGELSAYPLLEQFLQSRITVSTHTSLHSRIEMALGNVMEGDVQVFGRGLSELASQIKVSESTNLPARIKLTPMNRMTGLLDLHPIPRINTTLYPNKDSFIRDDVQRINYGSLPTMEVGKAVTPYSSGNLANFKSLIEFDFSKLPDGAIVEKANLILTTVGAKNVIDYLVDMNSSTWAENTVAWVNKPSISEQMELVDTGDGTHVVLDILPYVKKWVEREDRTDNYGITFYLKEALNTITLFTKEYDIIADRPKLELTYYDRDASVSIGSSKLNGRIIVRRDREHNLRGRIRIQTITGEEGLPSTIVVQNDGDLPSVIKVTREELPANIGVRRRDDEDLTSFLAIEGKGEEKLDSRIVVSRESLVSNITVAVHDSLPSSIFVAAARDSELDAKMILSKEFVIGKMVVAERSDLSAKIVVQRDEEEKLDSQIRLAKSTNLNAFMIVAQHETLDSHIWVQQTRSRQITSIIYVERDGEAELKGSIKVDYKSELPATMYVNSPYLPSRIYIAQSDEDVLNATIRVSDNLTAKDLNSVVKVGHWEELHATIKVTSDVLPSTLSIPGADSENLDARIQVASFLINDLVAFLDMRNPRDLHSRITIESSEDTESSYVFIM